MLLRPARLSCPTLPFLLRHFRNNPRPKDRVFYETKVVATPIYSPQRLNSSEGRLLLSPEAVDIVTNFMEKMRVTHGKEVKDTTVAVEIDQPDGDTSDTSKTKTDHCVLTQMHNQPSFKPNTKPSYKSPPTKDKSFDTSDADDNKSTNSTTCNTFKETVQWSDKKQVHMSVKRSLRHSTTASK